MTSHPAEAARRLEEWGSRREWTGSDPYDGLNAERRVVRPLTRSVLGRRLLTQLVKRSPLDLRRALGVPPGQSPVALANAASAYALGGLLPREAEMAKLEAALAALERRRSPGVDEPCWGYHFDVQTRVFFYPRGAPNTIATHFAAMALLDAWDATGERRWLALAEGAADFFLRHVPQTESGTGAYFGYLAGDRTPIHNASMLACSVLARVAAEAGREDCRAAAERGVAWTLALQRADGSWPYGEKPGLEWVDNFHTGYVLESLMRCAAAGVEPDGGAALERGLAFWRRRLFDPDGAPRYTPDSRHPVDIQCVAQAIQTFALAAGREPGCAEAATRVFEFAERDMLRRDGAYAFQRRRLWSNRAAHVRWGQAPMLLALAHLAALERTAPASRVGSGPA